MDNVRDLLSHRSGLDRHEFIWYGAGISREEVLKRLRFVKPDWSFRSTSSAVSVALGWEVAAIPFAAIAADRPGTLKSRIASPRPSRPTPASATLTGGFGDCRD